jgi:2-keto-4-pentenoate hydratase/2-oxohepta-3-ene-1,7-dioic acid hydratase in catechol pathway
MRIVTYRRAGAWRAGAVVADEVFDIADALAAASMAALAPEPSVRTLLRQYGESLDAVGQAVDALARSGEGAPIELSGAELGPPVPDPGKVLGIGLNYKDHVGETGRKLPEFPDVFAKFSSTLIGPNDPIRGLSVTEQLDFEGELAIVIGRGTQGAAEEAALEHVAGAMILNDITARDLQYRGTQFLIGKAVDGSTPCGPALVTLDEVGDLQSLDLSTQVNGVAMQRSNTRQMIFSIPRIIAYISRTIALEPGDVITTGTPAGIGAKRTPPMWLRAGDVVSIEIENVGTLTNVVAD